MMEADDHQFKDVRLAFVAAISLNADSRSFDGEEWLEAYRENREGSSHYWKFNDGEWGQDSADGQVDGGTERTERIRAEYELVEQLFLNKVLTVDREQFELRRAVHAADYRVSFDRVDHEPLVPDIVVTHYEPFNVAMVTVNFQLESVSAHDLVYLKSLKWDSTARFEGGPGVTVHRDGELQSTDLEPIETESAYLNAWFQELFEDTVGVEDATLSHGDILDCIDIRGGEDGASVFEKDPAGPLYAVITGDEGYELNDDDVAQSFLDDSVPEMHTREYFRYFFYESSIVGLFDGSFPERKRTFGANYAKQYGSYRPYADYHGLASEVAALSDGMMFVGELLLTRHIALQELDRRLDRDQSEATGRANLRRYMGSELRAFIDLKQSALERLTEIEMLSRSLLWGAVPDLDGMFDHENRRTSVDRTLETLESSIRDEYNRRMQNGIISLTVITVVLTLWAGPGPAIWSFLQEVGMAIVNGLPALPW